MQLTAQQMLSLYDFFTPIDDRRRAQGRKHPLPSVLALAALWHDLGKAHPAFQYNIVIGEDDPPRDDFAKAPNWIDSKH